MSVPIIPFHMGLSAESLISVVFQRDADLADKQKNTSGRFTGPRRTSQRPPTGMIPSDIQRPSMLLHYDL